MVGAGGLLGRHVAERLSGSGGVLTTRIPWGDATESRAALENGLRTLRRRAGGGPWNIAWCAGAGVLATGEEQLEAERTTFAGFLGVLASCDSASDGAFFLASSAGGIYAGSAHPPFTEATSPRPLSAYGEVKLAMEGDLAAVAHACGMRTVIGRVANVYGRGQNIDKPQGLVSQLCKARFTGKPVSIHVPLDTLRDYLYVADCAEMVAAALRQVRRLRMDHADPVVVKVIASGQSTSIVGLIEQTRRVLRRRPPVLVAAAQVARTQARDLRLHTVVWPELDSARRTPLPVGIAATAADVQQRLRSRRGDHV
ncbi:MAG: NAD-dependent epimerase/dehydratase family protein [Jiangellaceae bacterium]